MSKGSEHGGNRELIHLANSIASGRYESPANLGKGVPLSTQQGAGGLVLAPKTQLLTQRFEKPSQWLVLLATPTRGAAGTSPWQAAFNNTSTTPSATNFTAPKLPDPAQGMYVELRWGAGGFAGVTRFDYPAVGAAFGITCDTIDLSVITPDPGTPATYTVDTLPNVGAWMVRGQAADPTPLRWLEAFNALTQTDPLYFMVKPYARRVHVAVDASDISVDFLDASNGILWRSRYVEAVAGAGVDEVITVPAQATTMLVGNTSSTDADFLCVEWQIGLV